MASEKVRTEDEVTLVLYDKDGNIKQTSHSKRPRTFLELFLSIIEKVIEHW